MPIEIASVSIPTQINLSGFNSGLKRLERTQVAPIEVSAHLNTKSLERDRRQLERTLAKPLSLTLEVDDTALMTLRRRLQRQAPYKVKAVVEVDTRAVQQVVSDVKGSISNLPAVKIKVDDSELTRLKRTHVREINQWMEANPIKVRVDTSELDAFDSRRTSNKRIQVDVQYNDPGYKPTASRYSATTVSSSSSGSCSTFDFAKPIDNQTKILDSCIENAADKIVSAIDKVFKSQQKGLLGEIASGLMMGATFSGGQALYDKAGAKLKQKVGQQRENRQAYQELSYKSTVATGKQAARFRQQKTQLQKEIAQEREKAELRQEMLQMNSRDIIQPLAKKVGVKAKTKAQAVEGILKNKTPQQIKSELPYIDNIRQEAAKTSQQLAQMNSTQLKSQLSNTTRQLRDTFKSLKGSGNSGQLGDLGSEIEKEYQNIIALLSQATEEDVKALLQSSKLQVAKIRKAVSSEQQKITQQQFQTQSGGVVQTQQQFLRRGKQAKFNPIQQRRVDNFKINADLVNKRAEQIYAQLGDLPADTERIALVSGGFAGKLGKSSKGISERMKPFLGEKTYVQHVNNPDTDDDVDYDQPGLAKVKWFKHVGKILARHNIGKGYSDDGIEAAAQAQALHRKAKEQGLNIPHIEGYGYSSGGYVMQNAAELTRENRVPFKGVGIGTPHYGVSNTATPEQYISILGEEDPLWMLQGKGGSKNLKRYAGAGKGHTLEKYTKNAQIQQDIFKFQGREDPFVLGNLFEEDMMRSMEAAHDMMSLNPKLRPGLKQSGGIDSILNDIAEQRQTIAEQIDNIPDELLEDIQAADEILQSLESQLTKGFDIEGRESKPLAQRGLKKEIPDWQKQAPTKKVNPLIENANKQAEELGKELRKRVPVPKIEPIINNGLDTYRGLTFRQAKQLELNYKNFFNEIAALSDFDISGRNLPGLVIDENLLEQQAADALYDIENNQIIISKELQKALSETPQGLQEYASQMEALVHEARHAMQFDLGELTMQDLQLGLKPGANLKQFTATSAQAQKAALESVDYAVQQNPAMGDRAKAVLGTVEADASDFEQHTQIILDNLVATETFENAFSDFKQEKVAFRKALEEIENLLSEGLNHITKSITDFGKGLATKAQTLLSGFLSGNLTRKESATRTGNFQYVRRGRGQAAKVVNQSSGIPDPWGEPEAEYRSAQVVSGTTPNQSQRLDPRGIGQRVRVRVRKPIQNTLESAQQATQQAVEAFNSRLENYVQTNVKETLTEVANLSGKSLDPANMPHVAVDNATTGKLGQEAFYNAKKNQIVISSRMRDLLQSNPEALEKYAKELQPLVAAARKSLDVASPDAEVEEFSKQTGAVYARIATRAKGKRSNMPSAVRQASEGFDGAVDVLAQGANEASNLKRKAELYFQSLKRAAVTPENMSKPVASFGKSGGLEALAGGDIKGFFAKAPFSTNNSMQSLRVAFGKRSAEPFGVTSPKGESTWERLYNRAIPKPIRQRGQEQREKLQQMYMANPKLPKNLNQLADQISKKFKIPIDLYARLNIKGVADAVAQVQKIVGGELDKLQEKAAALPYLGDMASKAVGGLKLLNVAGVGVGLTFMRFLSVVRRFAALGALATQIQLVVLQFDALRKSFVLTANVGNRGAEVFDRVMNSASQLGVDKATAATGATEIFGNVVPKMGVGMAEQVNRAAQESSLIYASNPQQSQQIFSAFGQLAQQSTMNMGDFQAIMNAMPGSLDTAARSMGMTNAEFTNFIQNNSVLVEDFLPRFIQQLNVDNQPRLAGAMDTLTTATNRYNNAIVDMQLEVGKTIAPMEKLRVSTLAFLAESVGKFGAGVFAKWGMSMAILSAVKAGIAFKNVFAALFPIIAKLPFVPVALGAIGLALKHVLPLIIKMSLEFLLFQLAIDAVMAVFKSFSNAGGQFTTWADNSAANIAKMTEAFDKASQSADQFKRSLPTNEKDLQATSSRFEDTLIGSIFGKKNVRWAEGQLDKGLSNIPGYKTFAQKELYDKEEAVQRLRESGGVATQKVMDLRMGKDTSLRQMVAIDKQLETVRGKRRALAATNPADITGMRQLREQERVLVSQKDVVATPIASAQSAIASQIKTYEDALAKIDEEAREGAWTQEAYDRATSGLKQSLTEAEKAQKYLNSQIKDSATALQALQRHFASLNAQLADNANTLQQGYNKSLTNIYSNDSLSSAQKQFAQQASDQELLAGKLQANKQTALEMKESLAAQGGEDILTNWNVDVNTTGVQGYQLLAQRAEQQGNAKEQEVFTQYARIAELELETSDMEAQVAQRRSEAQQQLRDLNKQVDEYYRGISRQAAESQIQLAQQVSEIQNQQFANQINMAMMGVGDNIISQFVGSLLDAITQIAQAADTDLNAQSQILQAQNAFEDTFRSGEELRKQLPAISTTGELPTIPVQVDLSTVAANSDIRELNTEIKGSVSATNELQSATSGFNSTVADSGNLLNANTDATQNLESAISSVSGAVDTTVQSADNLNMSVSFTTDSAAYLQSQIDANTMSVDQTDAAMQGVGASIDVNTQKTAVVTEQSKNWWTELLNAQNIGVSIQGIFTNISNGILDAILKTVDWFKTFANNIPILNQIGQTLSGFGQQVANSGVGQAVQGAGNLINQGVGAVQGMLGMGKGVGKIGGYSIVESVGGSIQKVNSFRDLEKHHPSSGREAGRSYETIDGELEEIRKTKDGRTLIKKDFVLSKNGSQNVDIPAFAEGYIKRLNDKVNTVQIYQDKAMTKLIGQSLHMNNIPVKTGDFVRYGQSIGKQSGAGGYATHAHLEMQKEQFEKYVADLKSGNFAGVTGKVAEHSLGDGHNHFGEEDVKKANQGIASSMVGSAQGMLTSMGGGSVPTSASGQNSIVRMRRTGQLPKTMAPPQVQQQAQGNSRFTMPLPTGGNLKSGANQNKPAWLPKMDWNQHKQFLVKNAMAAGITDPNQIKYLLATAEHETGKGHYMREGGSANYLSYLNNKLGNRGNADAVAYRGAGYSQLTGKSNFEKWSPIVSKHFGQNIDLVNNPDLAAHPDIAAFILAKGMKEGSITGRGIDKYINTGAGKVDFKNARRTINGISTKQLAQIDKVLAGIPLSEVQQLMANAQSGKGAVTPTQQAAMSAVAPMAQGQAMQVWTPQSVSQAGNARITQAQSLAATQRDEQKRAASQQALVQAESGSIQALQKGFQSLVQVEKQLRQSGYETRDLFEDVEKMTLESLGPLSLPEQRKQRQQELQRQFRDSREKVGEKIIDVQNRQKSAKAILEQPGGIISPAMREKFEKLISMPISEDLKTKLQEAMTTGMFGDQLRSVLQRSITQGEKEITTLQKASKALESGEQSAMKAAKERFDFEEKARANAAKFEQESLNIGTLQAQLEQVRGQAERDPFGGYKEQATSIESLIGLRQQQLDYEKQLQEIEGKVRNKDITEQEAEAQRKSIGEKKKITDQTIQENKAYQDLMNTRAKDTRNREASFEATRSQLAVQRQQLEALKALPTTDAARAGIPMLEYQIELSEIQLKLQEEIAAVNEQVFKKERTDSEGQARIATLKAEYELNVQNLGVRQKQATTEQEIAQQRAILGIREQELGFSEQLIEAQTRAIELGRQSGDTLGDRFGLQKQQQQLGFEKQILDVKELALQSGKSAEEVAAIETKLREINEIKLGNIQAEMDKAFSDRAFAVSQRIGESNNSVLGAQQSLMSTMGFGMEANRLGKQIAVNEQGMNFANQKRELDEFIKTNNVAAAQANVLRSNLESVNDIKFREIEAQFNPLKGVIDSTAGALKGAFKSLIKDGKVDFDSFFDGILDSIAEFLSNMLVEQLMGFLSPNKDKSKGGGMFPNATADPNAQPGAGGMEFSGILGGLGGELGTTPMAPMYVSAVNSSMGFAAPANNIVPFNSPGFGWGNTFASGLDSFGIGIGSLFGKSSGISANSFLGGGGGENFTATNPLPVNMTQAKPNLFGSLFGGGAGGGGGLGGILGSLMGGLGGGGGGMGGGFGGILGMVMPLVGSLFGGIFAQGGIVGGHSCAHCRYATGGVIGTGKSKKDDQLILAQRGEGILTHDGMRAIGGAVALNAINRGGRVPKFARGGMIKGEYGTHGADAVEYGQQERRMVKNEPIKLETTVINGVEYATIEQVRAAANEARSAGAKDGAKFVSDKMQNSPSFRNRMRF